MNKPTLQTTELLCVWILLVTLGTIPVAGQTTKPSSNKREAQVHYKTAQIALEQNDLAAAQEELQRAVDLDSRNSVLWYNLAVVQSKNGSDDLAEASLERAQTLGLPANLKDKAVDLSAQIAYGERKVPPKGATVSELLQWVDKAVKENQPKTGRRWANAEGDYIIRTPSYSIGVENGCGLALIDETDRNMYIAKRGEHVLLRTRTIYSSELSEIALPIEYKDGFLTLISSKNQYFTFTSSQKCLSSGCLMDEDIPPSGSVERVGIAFAEPAKAAKVMRVFSRAIEACKSHSQATAVANSEVRTETASTDADTRHKPVKNEQIALSIEESADQVTWEAISIGWCVKTCEMPPEIRRQEVQTTIDKWKFARLEWAEALEKASEPDTVNRLQSKIQGNTGLTCGPHQKPFCIVNGSNENHDLKDDGSTETAELVLP